MKTTVYIKKEVEIDRLVVKAGVRYWNDCRYSVDNGKTWIEAEDDTEEISEEFKKHIPFIIKGDIGYGDTYYWNIVIDIDSGKVENWPKDFCLSTWFKVCDDGLYQILDTEDNVVWDSIESKDYYVPDFLSLGDNGYGDYIFLDIDGEGNIKLWQEQGIPEIKNLFDKENE